MVSFAGKCLQECSTTEDQMPHLPWPWSAYFTTSVSEAIIPVAANGYLGPFPAVAPVILCHLLMVVLRKAALEVFFFFFNPNAPRRKLACAVLGLSVQTDLIRVPLV